MSLLAASLPVLAQPLPVPDHTITTSGHGEVKVMPDSMQVTVSVESQASSQEQVRNETNQTMNRILAALKALNIPNRILKTQSVRVYPIYSQQEKTRLNKIIGYRATNTLSITVTNASPDSLANYSTQIVDTAMNAGAQNVGGISFYVSNLEAPRARALEEAVKDAARNAQVMASAANVTITGLYSLEGSPQYGGYPQPMAAYSRAEKNGVSPTPVEIGETTITSDITARYKF